MFSPNFHSVWIDFAYGLTALCIAYKVAWINHRLSYQKTFVVHLLRFSGAAVAAIIIFKAMSRFSIGGDAATWIDVAREATWCVFLGSAIAHLRGDVRPARRWFGDRWLRAREHLSLWCIFGTMVLVLIVMLLVFASHFLT